MDQESMEFLIGNLLDLKLNPILETLDVLKLKIDKIDNLEAAISFLSNQYDDLTPKIKKPGEHERQTY
jgi:hypothetical protein